MFVVRLDLDKLGFHRVAQLDIGWPSCHPRKTLKLYTYGNLNQVPWDRRLEQESQRNIEVIWLTGQLALDPSRSPNPSGATARPIARSARVSLRCAAGPGPPLPSPDVTRLTATGRCQAVQDQLSAYDALGHDRRSTIMTDTHPVHPEADGQQNALRTTTR